MARYTKHNSNYIRTDRHQSLIGGSTLFERDWVTVGSQLNFGPGKIPYYTEGNFRFTTSVLPTYQKKHRNGIRVNEYTYEDVKNAVSTVNEVKVDEYTQDIRTFVYYGSCFELVRSSVEHIINTFPGNITLSNTKFEIPKISDPDETVELTPISNQFGIDLYTEHITDDVDPLKYLAVSRDKYDLFIEVSGKVEKYNINNYEVVWDRGNCIKEEQYKDVVTITITYGEGDNRPTIIFKGYVIDEDIVFCCNNTNFVEIRPKEEYIESYFENLKGFEKKLLNRKSEPLYSNVFITPLEHNLGYVYYGRTYTWPSKGYCIDITSVSYYEFLNRLTDMAQLYDELWTDNIWRRMTHESIKNYDWSYTREYEEGDEEDNVLGGERMHKVINVIGRVFDDIKMYIDKIKNGNRVTYNADRNLPNALISDRVELCGVDAYTTIPSDYEDITQPIFSYADNEFALYPRDFTASDADVEFMRRLALSCRRIMSTKGTRNAIDMIMGLFGYGGDDYEITEEYRTVIPRRYDECYVYNGSDTDKKKYLTQDEYDALTETDRTGYDPLFESGKTLGEEIVILNYNKSIELLYESDTSGIPVGSFTLYKKQEVDENTEELVPTTYLIPLYDQRYEYDGDFCFQSKGGWMGRKGADDILSSSSWTETMSYLHVASDIEELLSTNPNTLTNGDIYYVIDTYNEFSENPQTSHYFVIEDDFRPEQYSSWTPLDITIDISDGYSEQEWDYIKKAKYLSGIIPYNIGNNPHVGYGKYDSGVEYFEYMKKPFKYVIDTHNIDSDSEKEAEKVTFEVEGPFEGEKIRILENEYDENLYYLNSKVIHLKNKILGNNFYNKYFNEVILKYIMQVVPSTTIMILEGFEVVNE